MLIVIFGPGKTNQSLVRIASAIEEDVNAFIFSPVKRFFFKADNFVLSVTHLLTLFIEHRYPLFYRLQCRRPPVVSSSCLRPWQNRPSLFAPRQCRPTRRPCQVQTRDARRPCLDGKRRDRLPAASRIVVTFRRPFAGASRLPRMVGAGCDRPGCQFRRDASPLGPAKGTVTFSLVRKLGQSPVGSSCRNTGS